MFLGEIVKFKTGINSTRMKPGTNQTIIYTSVDLEKDLKKASNFIINKNDEQNSYLLREGDFVISLIKEIAGIVSKDNKNKILSANFIKAEFDPSIIDPWFLCYFLNESETIKRAKNIRSGIIGLSYLHITPDFLNSLEFNPPPIERQKKIGLAYRNLCRFEYALDKEKEDVKKLVIAVIKKEEKKGN